MELNDDDDDDYDDDDDVATVISSPSSRSSSTSQTSRSSSPSWPGSSSPSSLTRREGQIKTAHVTPPHTLSINALLRLYPRERLYVPPLRWTALHTDLLGCRFIHPSDHQRHADADRFLGSDSEQSPSFSPPEQFFYDQTPSSKTRPADNRGQWEDDSWWATYIGNSVERRAKNYKKDMWEATHSIQGIQTASVARLLDWGPLRVDFDRHKLTLHFGGLGCKSEAHDFLDGALVFGSRRPRLLVTGGITLYPLLVWLEYRFQVDFARKDLFPTNFTRRDNKPAYCTRQRRLAQLTPRDKNRDPFIAATIIALAQAQRRWEHEFGPRLGHNPDNVTVYTARLVIADVQDRATWHIYTANVASSFLDKFECPSAEPRTPTTLDVIYEQIPTKPERSLRHRLFRRLDLLGSDDAAAGGWAEEVEAEDDTVTDSDRDTDTDMATDSDT